jgi:hypothetical protein
MPGGNITGFALMPEFSISAKWLELTKQIAPAASGQFRIRWSGPRQNKSGRLRIAIALL